MLSTCFYLVENNLHRMSSSLSSNSAHPDVALPSTAVWPNAVLRQRLVSQPVNAANPAWNLSLDWRDVSSFVQNAILLHSNTPAKCHSFILKKQSVLMHLVFYIPLHVRKRHSPATLRRGGALAQSPGSCRRIQAGSPPHMPTDSPSSTRLQLFLNHVFPPIPVCCLFLCSQIFACNLISVCTTEEA